MIRVVSIASLVTLLVLVLYLPAARPAPAFLSQIRAEHAALSSFWGKTHAMNMLEGMLELQPRDVPHPPLMPPSQGQPQGEAAVHREVAAVSNRLLNNDYFRSLNSLVLLATYRVAVLRYLLSGTLPFLLGAIVDGIVRRAVKSTDFSGHNPETFSACTCGVIVTTCAIVVACVLPMQLPVVLLPALVVAIGLLTNLGIANYPKRS